MPPNSAVRLCLTVACSPEKHAARLSLAAKTIGGLERVRQSLTALGCGKATNALLELISKLFIQRKKFTIPIRALDRRFNYANNPQS